MGGQAVGLPTAIFAGSTPSSYQGSSLIKTAPRITGHLPHGSDGNPRPLRLRSVDADAGPLIAPNTGLPVARFNRSPCPV